MSKWLLGTLAALAVVCGVAVYKSNDAGASYAPDCDNNAIMKCGAGSATQFITKAKANEPGDLPAVYESFGLSPSEYSRFVRTARPGVVYKDGRAVVDGQLVGTNTWSLGRHDRPNSVKEVIDGKTYYGSRTRDSFVSDGLPGMAMFTPDGSVEFMVLNSCGNPLFFDQKAPKYSCDMLHKSKVDGEANSYQFWTNATAQNNAVIDKVVYDFGDGKSATAKNPETKVTHAYTKPGNYTVKVTVHLTIPGKQAKTATSANCQTQITIEQPFQQCVALTSRATSPKDRTYQFTATTKQGNGSTLKSATFDFGDGKSAVNVQPASATKVSTDHTYEKAGSYTIKATVTFTTPYGAETVDCQTAITISPEMCPIKPSVPKDSPECAPCPYDANLPKDSPACVPPAQPTPPQQELPKTGVGSVIGLFSGTSAIGGIGYHLISRRLRR